jgi:hypothetical protein
MAVKEKIEPTMQVFTTRLPKRLIAALRLEKQKTGRATERILADIISQHYAETMEAIDA